MKLISYVKTFAELFDYVTFMETDYLSNYIICVLITSLSGVELPSSI